VADPTETSGVADPPRWLIHPIWQVADPGVPAGSGRAIQAGSGRPIRATPTRRRSDQAREAVGGTEVAGRWLD
jgi:hypothetical protein